MGAEQRVSEETGDDEERCVQRDYDLVFEWSCMKAGDGLDDPRGCLPTQDVLRFCKVWDSFKDRFQSLALPSFCPGIAAGAAVSCTTVLVLRTEKAKYEMPVDGCD